GWRLAHGRSRGPVVGGGSDDGRRRTRLAPGATQQAEVTLLDAERTRERRGRLAREEEHAEGEAPRRAWRRSDAAGDDAHELAVLLDAPAHGGDGEPGRVALVGGRELEGVGALPLVEPLLEQRALGGVEPREQRLVATGGALGRWR